MTSRKQTLTGREHHCLRNTWKDRFSDSCQNRTISTQTLQKKTDFILVQWCKNHWSGLQDFQGKFLGPNRRSIAALAEDQWSGGVEATAYQSVQTYWVGSCIPTIREFSPYWKPGSLLFPLKKAFCQKTAPSGKSPVWDREFEHCRPRREKWVSLPSSLSSLSWTDSLQMHWSVDVGTAFTPVSALVWVSIALSQQRSVSGWVCSTHVSWKVSVSMVRTFDRVILPLPNTIVSVGARGLLRRQLFPPEMCFLWSNRQGNAICVLSLQPVARL